MTGEYSSVGVVPAWRGEQGLSASADDEVVWWLHFQGPEVAAFRVRQAFGIDWLIG